MKGIGPIGPSPCSLCGKPNGNMVFSTFVNYFRCGNHTEEEVKEWREKEGAELREEYRRTLMDQEDRSEEG